MTEVLADARRENMVALVLPCIGYRWHEKDSLDFEDVYNPLFKALDGSERPLKVFISLYDMWPSVVIEDAIRALNRATGTAVPTTAVQPSH